MRMSAQRENADLPTMIRNIFIFLATFTVGALIAFGARAALHKPDAAVTEHTTKEHAAMVSNPLTPASNAPTAGAGARTPAPAKKTSAPAPGSDHHGHDAAAASPTATAEVVNSVCAICGMKVDPSLPTLEYQGKKIGFGCKMCAPKFKADPDKYGPAYLKNEVIKR
jgi:YHS domain-containing protein